MIQLISQMDIPNLTLTQSQIDVHIGEECPIVFIQAVGSEYLPVVRTNSANTVVCR